jgi:hypothetical protein
LIFIPIGGPQAHAELLPNPGYFRVDRNYRRIGSNGIWSYQVPTDIEEFTVGWSESLRVRLKHRIQANEVAQHP